MWPLAGGSIGRIDDFSCTEQAKQEEGPADSDGTDPIILRQPTAHADDRGQQLLIPASPHLPWIWSVRESHRVNQSSRSLSLHVASPFTWRALSICQDWLSDSSKMGKAVRRWGHLVRNVSGLPLASDPNRPQVIISSEHRRPEAQRLLPQARHL